ncbi:MAG: RNA 2'-phosphotransferase [Promethearchaeota archaeon]|nr:MAG: RNA 2'-phosphotransferase [Candidatus Lokiarchaeota archaeon]
MGYNVQKAYRVNKLYTRISKFLSYILRHHPEKFGIELDAKGYTNLDTIVNLVKVRFPKQKINEDTIKDIIKTSDKRRFEIVENKIRAFYGHSFQNKIKMEKVEFIPEVLFHGTNLRAFETIKKEGLKRKKRQYVHLSESVETAYSVGKRRTNSPLILMIDSNRAIKDGIKFYKSGDMYLADYIPPKYISLHIKNP